MACRYHEPARAACRGRAGCICSVCESPGGYLSSPCVPFDVHRGRPLNLCNEARCSLQTFPDPLQRGSMLAADVPGSSARGSMLAADVPGSSARGSMLAADVPGSSAARLDARCRRSRILCSEARCSLQTFPDPLHEARCPLQTFPDPLQRGSMPLQRFPDPLREGRCPLQTFPDPLHLHRTASQVPGNPSVALPWSHGGPKPPHTRRGALAPGDRGRLRA
jgi:hypothetical protein